MDGDEMTFVEEYRGYEIFRIEGSEDQYVAFPVGAQVSEETKSSLSSLYQWIEQREN